MPHGGVRIVDARLGVDALLVMLVRNGRSSLPALKLGWLIHAAILDLMDAHTYADAVTNHNCEGYHND